MSKLKLVQTRKHPVNNNTHIQYHFKVKKNGKFIKEDIKRPVLNDRHEPIFENGQMVMEDASVQKEFSITIPIDGCGAENVKRCCLREAREYLKRIKNATPVIEDLDENEEHDEDGDFKRKRTHDGVEVEE